MIVFFVRFGYLFINIFVEASHAIIHSRNHGTRGDLLDGGIPVIPQHYRPHERLGYDNAADPGADGKSAVRDSD